MSYAKRIVQLPTSRIQHVVALSATAAVAFTLGFATSPVQRAVTIAPSSVQSDPAAVAPAPASAGALYDGGWAGGPAAGALFNSAPSAKAEAPAMSSELYDGGWAGGPGPSALIPHEPVAMESGFAATELYDGGWAGGPPPHAVANNASTDSRVPYDAGWTLYDGGWAGGPVVTNTGAAINR